MASRDPHRPNVLYIVADDMGAWALGAGGNSDAITPALDRLAAEGVRMDNFFCTSPVCSPARASLLSGTMPSQHGVHDWIADGHAGPDRTDFLHGRTLLPDVLADHDYRLGLVGKWHLGASDVPRDGFVRWYAHERGSGPYFGAPMFDETTPATVDGYLSDDLADHAMRFLDSEETNDHPFWLNLAFTAPHDPWVGQHPADLLDLYSDCDFDSCPQEVLPPWLAPTYHVDDVGANLRGYFAAVTGMDRAIGRVVDRLDSRGLRDNTLVIFVSDNGFNVGHHGIWGKGNGTTPQNMFDTSVKVPAIFCHPGRIPAGKVVGDLLSGYDLAPTVLDYLNIEWHDDQYVGTSFADVLTGEAHGQRDSIVVYDEYGPVRMIRTRDWKYVNRHPDGPHELFDLTADPGERTNLYGRPEHESRVADMRRRLAGWFHRHIDPARDGENLAVAGLGQTGMIDARTGDNADKFVQR